jgi:hypothetical protein
MGWLYIYRVQPYQFCAAGHQQQGGMTRGPLPEAKVTDTKPQRIEVKDVSVVVKNNGMNLEK